MMTRIKVVAALYLGGRHNFRKILQQVWTENVEYAGLWPGFMAVEICYRRVHVSAS
jgi:hypothetical protein